MCIQPPTVLQETKLRITYRWRCRLFQRRGKISHPDLCEFFEPHAVKLDDRSRRRPVVVVVSWQSSVRYCGQVGSGEEWRIVGTRLHNSRTNIFTLPAKVFSSCLAIVSAVMVGGLFLWPALRYGTGYQTVWEIWPSAETPSSVHWRLFYFQLTRVHSALEFLKDALYKFTYLLTYLLNWWVYLTTNVRSQPVH